MIFIMLRVFFLTTQSSNRYNNNDNHMAVGLSVFVSIQPKPHVCSLAGKYSSSGEKFN